MYTHVLLHQKWMHLQSFKKITHSVQRARSRSQSFRVVVPSQGLQRLTTLGTLKQCPFSDLFRKWSPNMVRCEPTLGSPHCPQTWLSCKSWTRSPVKGRHNARPNSAKRWKSFSALSGTLAWDSLCVYMYVYIYIYICIHLAGRVTSTFQCVHKP